MAAPAAHPPAARLPPPARAPRADVQALPLAPGLRARLLAAGYRTAGDLEAASEAELVADAALTPAEAAAALASLPPPLAGLAGAASAARLLADDAAVPRVLTFCAPLDELLGGGVAPSQVTEFCGEPGVGKTQLCLQLAVDVQVPRAFDTEGSVVAERAAEVASGLARHLGRLAARGDARGGQGGASGAGGLATAAAGVTVDSLLAGITLLRARDAAEQAAAIQHLPALLAADPGVRLVIVDSVAFHVRAAPRGAGPAARARALAADGARLARLAREHGVAVVVTNQVTTRVRGRGGGGSGGGDAMPAAAPAPGGDAAATSLAPALGAAWAHVPTTRVALHWAGGERWASLLKSPCLPPGKARFDVVADGVRGPPRAGWAAKRGRTEGEGWGGRAGGACDD